MMVSRVLFSMGIGALSYVLGAFLAAVGTMALLTAMQDSLNGAEALLFKGFYTLIVLAGIAVAGVFSVAVANLYRQSLAWSLGVALFLYSLTFFSLAPILSLANQCTVGVEYPLPVKGGCD